MRRARDSAYARDDPDVAALAGISHNGGAQVFDTAVQQPAHPNDGPGERQAASDRFARIRRDSEALAANLAPEDQAIQSMPDVSPTKWHLAHTSWFFEAFLLEPFDPGYRVFDPAFAYLFNSYYEAAGPRHPRPQRGLLSRPTVADIAAYRDHVTAAMLRLIDNVGAAAWPISQSPPANSTQPRAGAAGGTGCGRGAW